MNTKLKKILPPIFAFTVIFVFIVALLFHHILYIIYPGHAGVHWSFYYGTEVDKVYPEGFHLIFPWDELYIYDVRIQEISQELKVLSRTGLKVNMLFSIRYRPKYNFLGLLHQNIGMDYPQKVIVPEIESVLRETIGTMNSEQIYTTGRKVIAEAIESAIEQLHRRYIQVDDVLIRRITLPDIVENAIKYKIEQKHLVQAHEFIVQKEKKEAKRKYIEAIGIKNKNLIIIQSLKDKQLLQWEGIQASKEFARSENSKILIIGDKDGLPVIFNASK